MFIQKQWDLDQAGIGKANVGITFADTPYTPPQNVTRIGVDTTDGVVAVKLRAPEEMHGRMVEVYVDVKSSNCTIDGEGLSQITLDAVDEWSLLWSSGKDWHEVAANHA